MKNLKYKLIVAGMAISTGLAFFASTAGTLAWYAYSTRSILSFTGTSIRKSELIHVGLIDGEWEVDEEHPGNVDIPSTHKITDDEVDGFSLQREAINGKSIIWTTSSTGFPKEAIKLYLERYSSAYNFLSPVSSKTREASGALNLYRSPGYGETSITEAADYSQYVTLPFAFKSIGSNNENLKNKKIWLVDAEVLAQSEGKKVNKAVRLHVHNPNEEFLINPSITGGTTGYTTVAGLLDLDGDGTYDFDPENGNKEYIYGSYTGTPTYEANPYVVPQDPEDYLPDNVNHIDFDEYPEDLSTFYAMHKGGAYLPVMGNNRYITGVTYGQANYYTLGGVKPSIDSDGYFDEDTGKPLTTTDETYGIGLATLTVYLEGWDHSVVNEEIGTVFNLGLTFEINKL